MPSRSDIALPFDYEAGEFSLSLLCGDILLAAPLRVELLHVDINFGAVPAKPVYPIYSKPLMYESENSVKPLKEIEHVFRPENKNPFFLFPFAFSTAVVALILLLLLGWKKVGADVLVDSSVKRASKFMFFLCIAAIALLYVVFWFGWNMISLLKVLIPLALLTAIVGNRALSSVCSANTQSNDYAF